MTTEKELDTVEVLKAIQKAKEAKDRMNSGDKKVHGVTPDATADDSYQIHNHRLHAECYKVV